MKEDFSRRSLQTELMDEEDCGLDEFRDCLRDLAKVNVLTLAHGPTLQFLDRLRRDGRLQLGRAVEIVDVGSGYGDLLRRIDRWGKRRGVPLRLTGVDLNPWSAQAAAEVTDRGRPIRWVTSDIFDYREGPDIVVCSLFTHHLSDAQLPRFLAWMEGAARIGWFVNDLHRHPLPYVGFGWLAALMRWHRFVRHDGPVSIARAFTRPDWLRSLAQAGIAAGDVDIRWRFPFRLCLGRIKPQS